MASVTREMETFAIGLVTLAAVTLLGLALVSGFKDTNTVDNATADLFSAGLKVLAGFVGLLALLMVVKVIIGLVKQQST